LKKIVEKRIYDHSSTERKMLKATLTNNQFENIF